MKASLISLILFLIVLGVSPLMAQKAKPAAKGKSKTTKAAPTKKGAGKQETSLAEKALKKERLAILDEICACSKNEGLNNLSNESQNQKFGLCILEARSNHRDAFIKIYGDQDNEEDYSWAEKVGLDLSMECPYLSRLFSEAQSDTSASAGDTASAMPAARPMTAEREKVLNNMCRCFEDKKASTETPMVKITGCLLGTYEKDRAAFEAEYGKIGPEGETNRDIGRQIGAELAPRCPAFMEVVAKMIEEQNKEQGGQK